MPDETILPCGVFQTQPRARRLIFADLHLERERERERERAVALLAAPQIISTLVPVKDSIYGHVGNVSHHSKSGSIEVHWKTTIVLWANEVTAVGPGVAGSCLETDCCLTLTSGNNDLPR